MELVKLFFKIIFSIIGFIITIYAIFVFGSEVGFWATAALFVLFTVNNFQINKSMEEKVEEKVNKRLDDFIERLEKLESEKREERFNANYINNN